MVCMRAGLSCGWDAGFSGTGAAHSSERSQPLHLETEHLSSSHQPTWLTLTYLKMIMKMYYLDRGRKSTYSGRLTVNPSVGRDHKTWKRLQFWVAEHRADINGTNLRIHLWGSQMQASLLLCQWPCQTDLIPQELLCTYLSLSWRRVVMWNNCRGMAVVYNAKASSSTWHQMVMLHVCSVLSFSQCTLHTLSKGDFGTDFHVAIIGWCTKTGILLNVAYLHVS